MKPYTYVIIGASAAGISAVNTLWRLDPMASIICVSDQESQPYNTCLLTDVASGGKTAEKIALRIAHQRIDFKFGTKATSIDCEKKLILLSDNSTMLYQKLLLAMGSRPTIPEIAKIGVPGVFAFHTLADAQGMLDWMQKRKVAHAVIIGAGLTGLECADMLHNRGIKVTIIEKKGQVLSELLALGGATVIHDILQEKRVMLLLGQMVTQVTHDDEGVAAVILADGNCIKTDMVIWAVGVQPNNELALCANLAMQKSYIAVNEYMQTSNQAIFAAGDVAIMHNQKKKMHVWVAAVHQGMIAAHAMTGIMQPYVPQPILVHSRFFELNVASILSTTADNLEKQETYNNNEYLHIVFEKRRPVGLQFVGKKIEVIADIRRSIFSNSQLSE